MEDGLVRQGSAPTAGQNRNQVANGYGTHNANASVDYQTVAYTASGRIANASNSNLSADENNQGAVAAISKSSSSHKQTNSPPQQPIQPEETTNILEASRRVATVAERMSEQDDGEASP